METIIIPGYDGEDVLVTMFECEDRNIKQIGHDASSNRLCVAFSNGFFQVYQGISAEVFERFCTAPSKHDFWEACIQADLPCAPHPNGWQVECDPFPEIALEPTDWLGKTG